MVVTGGVLDGEGDAGPLAVNGDNDAAVGRQVGLTEQRHFVAHHRVRQVIHDDLTRRSSCHRLLALHHHQTICNTDPETKISRIRSIIMSSLDM